MYQNLFIHSSVNEHLGYFLVLAIVNSTAMNIGVAIVQLLSCVHLFAKPMDCSTPGFPVHHQLLELIQTYVHQVSDAIQPSHPLSSPSLLTFNLSQH